MDPDSGVGERTNLLRRHPAINTLAWLDDKTSPQDIVKFLDHSLTSVAYDLNGRYFCLTEEGHVFVWTPEDEPQELALPCQFVISVTCSSDCLYLVNDRGKIYCSDLKCPEKLQQHIPILKSPSRCCSHGYYDEERVSVRAVASGRANTVIVTESGQIMYWLNETSTQGDVPRPQTLSVPSSVGQCHFLAFCDNFCWLLCDSDRNEDKCSSPTSSSVSLNAFDPKYPLKQSFWLQSSWQILFQSRTNADENVPLLHLSPSAKSHTSVIESTRNEGENVVSRCPHCRPGKLLPGSQQSSTTDSTLTIDDALENESVVKDFSQLNDTQNATVLKEVWSKVDSLVRQSSTAIFPNTDTARQFLSKQLSAIQMDEGTRDILKENVNHVASVVAQSVKNVGEQVHRLSKHWSGSSSADESLEPEFGTDAASVPLQSLNERPEIGLNETEPERWQVCTGKWNQESPSCLSLDSYVTQQAQKEAQLQVQSKPECQKSLIASTLRQLSKRGFRRLSTCVLFGSFGEGQPTIENVANLNQKGVYKIVVGKNFSLALSWDGTAFLSLVPPNGKIIETQPVKLPVKPEVRVTFRDVAAGENHALLLSDRGEVFVVRPNSDEKTQCVRLDMQLQINQRVNYVLAAGRASFAVLADVNPVWNDFLVSERLFLRSLVDIWFSLIQVLPKTSPNDHFGVREALFDSYKQILGLVAENVSSLVHGKVGLLLWAEPLLAGWKEYLQSVCQALVMNGFQPNKSESALIEQAWPSLWPLLLNTQLRKSSSPFQVLMVEPLNRLKAYVDFLKVYPDKEKLSVAEKERWRAIEVQYEAAFQANERECQSADFTRAFWDSVPVKLAGMLATPQRRLLRESRSQPLQLHQAHRFTSHWFILFTDILVHVQYSTHTAYALETLWVESLPDLEATHLKHALSLQTPEESLVVTCPTAMDKVEWLLALQGAIKSCLGDKREGISRPSPPLTRHASYVFTKGSYKDAVYSGMWLCSKLQGQGELRWPDGRCYKGNFRQGLRHGLGRLDTPTASGTIVYEGHWKEDKQSGYAVLQYANGDVYEGYFKDGLPQGHGSLKKGHLMTSAASVYVGEWEAGLRQGYGVLDDISAGEKCMGMWFADAKHGPAVIVTLDGLYMEGTFQNHKMIGEALLLFEDGSSYEGEVSAPGVFAGKGVLQWPRGDTLEGTFTGAWSEGIKVNGVLHKAVAPSSMSNSIDRFNFASHPVPSSLGQLCVPAHRKWESLFRHGYQVLGLPYPCYSPINPSLTTEAWDQVAVLISQAKSISSNDLSSLKTSTAENMTRVRRGSGSAAWTHKWREWSKAERLEGLEKIPHCARTTLTYEEYKEMQAYLAKAFDCPLHPLGRLLCQLVDVYRATYVGIGAHARLLSQAVAELRSILSRLYGLVRVLFPALPVESQPLSLSSEAEPDAEVVTASSLLFPFLLPRLYPPLFTLYALANEKADELYWDRLVKWNRQGDYALFAFLGIDQKFWSSNSPCEENHTEVHFNATVESLQQLSTTFCPQEKLLVIQNTFQEINKAVVPRLGPNYLWTMDDLFPIFQFVVVRARIRHLGSEIHLMDDLMEKHVQLGELGIMFTTLKACYFQIQHEKMNFS